MSQACSRLVKWYLAFVIKAFASIQQGCEQLLKDLEQACKSL